MTSEPPRRIAKLVARFRITSPCGEEDFQKLVNAGKTCPVRRSLHPDVVVERRLRAGLNAGEAGSAGARPEGHRSGMSRAQGNRSASTSKPAATQASRPPSSGRTSVNPRSMRRRATRAAEASFGHVQ